MFEFEIDVKAEFDSNHLLKVPVYNDPSVEIRPFVCALVALFLYTLKWFSRFLFFKAETISCDKNFHFTFMQGKLSAKMQQILK